MNFLLLIIAFSGQLSTNYYNTAKECELALINSTDKGQYKNYEVVRCIDLNTKNSSLIDSMGGE